MITFGVIVFNGEPFTRYCLRQLYPHAHQIIVVEGACPGASSLATPDGHSTDGTLQTLQAFKAHEDPDSKLILVTRDGCWSEKDEMSQAYAERATGDYLWQVDVDEFYSDADLDKVRRLLRERPEITALSFRQLTFWGSPGVLCDGFYLRALDASQFHRLFKWGEGYRYVTHRPPTVHTADGHDTRDLVWLDARATEKRGIFLYHASLLLPKQVRDKCIYYAASAWSARAGANRWAEQCYLGLRRPFRVHNVERHMSWLEPYDGPLPEQLAAMWRDLETHPGSTELRPMQDVDRLLAQTSYRRRVRALRAVANCLAAAHRNRFLRPPIHALRFLYSLRKSRRLHRLLGIK